MPKRVEVNERWSAMVGADLSDEKKQHILNFVNWIDRNHLPLNQFNDPATPFRCNVDDCSCADFQGEVFADPQEQEGR